jgi:hypothetical protein
VRVQVPLSARNIREGYGEMTRGSQQEAVRKSTFNSKKIPSDLRISVCTDCKYGIFRGQEFNWTSRGLVHTLCKH